MPSLSPTMTEGTIVKWLKKEGDSINPGDGICEIQTDKAVVTMELEEQGVFAKIILPEDTKDVKIGTLIALMVEEGEDWKDVDMPENEPQTTSPAAEAPISAPSPSTPPKSSPVTDKHETEYIPGGPSVRNLLHQYGLSVSQITPTGRRGKLLKGDVLKYIQEKNLKPVSQSAVPLPPKSSSRSSQPEPASPIKIIDDQEFVDIPLSNMRRTIAKRLTESKSSIPHAYIKIACKVGAIMELRKSMKEEGKSVSLNDFVIKASAAALERVPEVNVQWSGSEAKQVDEIDISIAVATDAGLITPIVKDVPGLGIEDISQRVKELADKARKNKLTPQEFMGGSFTISNLGMFGISEFTAIINPPQSAILAVGTSRVLLEEDEERLDLIPTTYMTVQLSYDARAVEEDAAARFLQAFCGFIESPGALLAGAAPSEIESRV